MSTMIILAFLSWCFPGAIAASLSDGKLPLVEKADLVVFSHFGSLYPNSDTVGIRINIAVQPIASMAVTATDLVESMEVHKLFQEFQKYHPAAKEAAKVLVARKGIIKDKTLELLLNFQTSQDWFINPETTKINVERTGLLDSVKQCSRYQS